MRGRAPMADCTHVHEQTRCSRPRAANAENAPDLLRAIYNHITATNGEPTSAFRWTLVHHTFLPSCWGVG